MVNPGKVVKARKSKRTSLHDKHKVERKVREHRVSKQIMQMVRERERDMAGHEEELMADGNLQRGKVERMPLEKPVA